MDHKVTEHFISLALNPESGRYMVLGNYLSYGTIGAMLMDLSLNEKINVDGNRVSPGKDTGLTGISAYDRMIKSIEGKRKERTVRKWVQVLGSRAGLYRKQVQRQLVTEGILKVENKRFIGIPYKLHRVAKPGSRVNLINRYKDIILYNKKPEEHEVMVLGLIYACRMHNVLSRGGPERRKIRKRLVEIIKDNVFAKDISKAILDIQAAITASIAATAAVSAATASSN